MEQASRYNAEYLADHVAVTKWRTGAVTAPELASFVEAFNDYAKSRVQGIGASQYTRADGGQKIQDHSPTRTASELLDELADAQVYLAKIAIDVLQISKELSWHE